MELQSPTNFSMLTERLHILFKRYIIDGRVRAPPEFELRDMIPTFQQGAKTNRRALQSKFKSWARRMKVLHGNLVLSSSGKIIIPEERCEEIIMELHRDDHMSINKVVIQIQKKYTWTKKNFGMDLKIVMNAISDNCKNSACQKEIRKATKTCYKKLFHGFPVTIIPRQFYQDSNIKCPEFYNAMEVPPRGTVSSIEYPILQSYLSNRYNTFKPLPERLKFRMNPMKKVDSNENYKKNILAKDKKHFIEFPEQIVTKHEDIGPKFDIPGKYNAPLSVAFMENQKNKFEALWSTGEIKHCFQKSLDTRGESESEKVNFSSPLLASSTEMRKNNHSFMVENDDLSKNSYSCMRSCKKPRNLHDFTKQLKDAQIYPEIYPYVFTDPKTQFLSALDLVPKRICSKKILTKFAKEQRKKRLVEKRRSWFVGERKVLRDRNKLNKRNSLRLKMRQEAYASFSKSYSSSFYHSSVQNSQKIRNDNFKKLKNTAKRPLRGQTEKSRMIKPQFILPKESTETMKKEPEIIEISSSDDEGPASQNFKDAKSEMSEPQIQSGSSSKQNGSSQYPDIRLFGCSAENEAVRNQVFYDQNYGYSGVFGTANLFYSQNNMVNFPVTSSNPSYQLNDSCYMNSQTQFPILRPFLVPTLSNNDIAVLQAGSFPMIRPLRPINPLNTNPYIKNLQPLPKNTNPFGGQFGNSPDHEQSLFVPNANVAAEKKESSTNIDPVPHQASQSLPDLKVFLVNKTPKKTYLIVPPNSKTYLNTAKKIIPILDRKQPIAPLSSSEKVPLKYQVAKELQQKRLNNALFGNVHHSAKHKEPRKDVQSEMARLSNWISKLKSSVTPTNFHKGVERFSHRLTNQLNVGITMVKGVRNALIEIEKSGESTTGDTTV